MSSSRLLRLALIAVCICPAALGGRALAQSNLIQNGDFTANAAQFTNWPGYIGGGNPSVITNWSLSGAGVGIDGTLTAATVFGPANPNVPAFYFAQAATTNLSQTFTINDTHLYGLQFDAAQRNNGATTAGWVVQIDGNALSGGSLPSATNLSNQNFNRYGTTLPSLAAFVTHSITFLPTNYSGDAAANLTNVQIVDLSGVWSGTTSGNLGGPDANFAGGTLDYAGATALTSSLYFNDTDGVGNTVANNQLTTVAGGVTAGTLRFGNNSVDYSLASSDTNGVTGGASILKSGAGLLDVSGTHTYTGGTTVNNGRLRVLGSQAVGSGDVSVNNGAYVMLWWNTGNATIANNFTLNGLGQVQNGEQKAAIYADGGGGGYGAYTISGNITLQSTSDLGGYFQNNLVVTGQVTGPGTLTKTGGNMVTLTNSTNNYSGGTNIVSGVLNAGDAKALVGTIDVRTGGALGATFSTGALNNPINLHGAGPALASTGGTPTITSTITDDGTAGLLYVYGAGRESGSHVLTLTTTLALGNKGLYVYGNGLGGNIDSIPDAQSQTVALTNATLTTNSDVTIRRGTLSAQGSTTATIGGTLRSTDAWSNFVMQDNAVVTVAGGVDFRAVASQLSFNGGTLNTPSIWGNSTFSGSTRTVFNGTRVVATADNADFLKVSNDFDQAAHTNVANLANGGLILDTNGHAISIANGLSDYPGHNGALTKQGAGTLTLTGQSTHTGPTTIASGTLRVTGGVATVPLSNFGLEAPALNPGNFVGYGGNPTGAGWTFSGSAGVSYQGPWFNNPAFQGNQAAFIQNVGSISQTINVSTAGAYNLSFMGEARSGYAGDDIAVLVDGSQVAFFNAGQFGQNNWQYFGASVNLAAGPHTISFAGQLSGGDNDTIIDAVQLTGSTFSPYSAINLTGSTSVFDLQSGNQAVASLAGVSGSSVLNGGSLVVGSDATNTTFAGVISGNGSLTKVGTGTLTLTGLNTYHGGTFVSGGTLRITAPNLLGDGALTLTDGGTLGLNFNGAFTTAVQLSGGGNQAISIGAAGNSTTAVTLTGGVTSDGASGTFSLLSGGRQTGTNLLTFSGATLTLGNESLVVNGAFNGNVDGPGDAAGQSFVLDNSTVTTNADVSVARGTLRVQGASSLTIGGSLRGGYVNGSDAWGFFVMQDSATITATGGVDFHLVASQFSLNGGTLITPSIWGNFTFGGQTRAIFNGTRIVASADNSDFLKVSNDFDQAAHSNVANLTSAGLVLDSNGHSVTIANTLADMPGYAGTVTKLGLGSLTLGTTNSYTGGTTVSNGTLRTSANGALAGGSLRVTAAAGVSSTVSAGSNETVNGLTTSADPTGAVTVGATPGNTLTVAAGGPTSITGTLNVNGGGTVQINSSSISLASGSHLNVNDNGTVLLLAAGSGTSGSLGAGVVATVTTGATLELAGSRPSLPEAVRIPVNNTGTIQVDSTGSFQLGGIDGDGGQIALQDGGATLTADHIIQGSITIGSGDTLTIAPSDASGTPLSGLAGSTLAVAGLTVDGRSLAGHSTSLLALRVASASPSSSVLGGAVGGGVNAVPEPSCLVLLAIGGVGLMIRRVGMRRRG